MNNSYKLFISTPPVKLFFIAAIPGAVSMLASSLYGLLDGIFVGRILGETAFAALNLAFPFVVINFSLADLIGVGSAVPISIALGKKDHAEANNIFTCACLMIVATGAVIGAVLYVSAPALLAALGAEGELATLAVQYMRVYAICSPVTTIIFAMDNYLRICGQIRPSMWLNIFMSALTAVLEFTFLYVFRWGVWGAALATCMGMLVCALIAFYPFARGKLLLHLCKPHFSVKMVRQILGCGVPNFLNNIAGRITSILMNMALIRLGGENAVSIYGVLMYAGEIVQPLLYGVCDSLQPAVGYNWGAQKYGRVKAIEKCCFIAGAVISISLSICALFFPSQIVGLCIGSADGALIQTGAFAMQLFSLTYLTRWFSFATQSYMTAVEKPLPASVISVSTALVFPVLLLAALWPLGLTGIWLNSTVSAVLAAVLAAVILIRFRRELRRRMRNEATALVNPD